MKTQELPGLLAAREIEAVAIALHIYDFDGRNEWDNLPETEKELDRLWQEEGHAGTSSRENYREQARVAISAIATARQSGADDVEIVAKAIAAVGEQNGAAPYELLVKENHAREYLFDQARAAITSLRSRQDVGGFGTAGAKFIEGDHVHKPEGYLYPGVVRSVFTKSNGDIRYVVEATHPDFAGMCHVFNEGQLKLGGFGEGGR